MDDIVPPTRRCETFEAMASRRRASRFAGTSLRLENGITSKPTAMEARLWAWIETVKTELEMRLFAGTTAGLTEQHCD
jgi:hypothetical protein